MENFVSKFVSVNGFVPASSLAQYEYYRTEHGEDDFPDQYWTVYEPSNSGDRVVEVINYLHSGVVLGSIETEYAVTIVDCSGMPVARLKEAGAILGRADNTDQVLINKIAELYAQLSN